MYAEQATASCTQRSHYFVSSDLGGVVFANHSSYLIIIIHCSICRTYGTYDTRTRLASTGVFKQFEAEVHPA